MSQLHTIFFFFFNDTATTEIYTLSLHDALPISRHQRPPASPGKFTHARAPILSHSNTHTPVLTATLFLTRTNSGDRKSTRLNSSHANISYAVFCLKKKKKKY